jgi:uncharacterized protein
MRITQVVNDFSAEYDAPVMDAFVRTVEYVGKLGSAALAFSGGFDSSFLACACKESGIRFAAVFADTPLVSRRQRVDAERIAQLMDIPLVIKRLEWEDMGGVKENGPMRCYFCKRAVYEAVNETAKEMDFACSMCGDNPDDLKENRPGRKASSEAGLLRPLETLGIGRSEIVEYVNSMDWSGGLVKNTCLATRIPSGTPLEDEDLGEVEEWEDFIADISRAENIRFRYFGNSAIIQTSAGDMEKIRNVWEELLGKAEEKGISLILDPEGYEGF